MRNNNNENDIFLLILIIGALLFLVFVIGIACAQLFNVDFWTGSTFIINNILLIGIFAVAIWFLKSLEIFLYGLPLFLSIEFLIFKRTILDYHIEKSISSSFRYENLWYDHWYVTLGIFLLINILGYGLLYLFDNRY